MGLAGRPEHADTTSGTNVSMDDVGICSHKMPYSSWWAWRVKAVAGGWGPLSEGSKLQRQISSRHGPIRVAIQVQPPALLTGNRALDRNPRRWIVASYAGCLRTYRCTGLLTAHRGSSVVGNLTPAQTRHA